MKIAIAGCGNMGLIYARAFLKYDIVSKENLLLAEKSETRKQELEKLNIGQVVVSHDPKISQSDIIIIAVKPQDFSSLATEIQPLISEKNLVISIMAGITIPTLESALQTKNIVRAMPNSPAELGMGMTGYSCMPTLTMQQVRMAENLLSTTGRCVLFEDEDMLDAVTAMSGSGPAYFFYVVKHMIDAGKQMGMEEAVASMLVKQTMTGAFHLINTAGKSLDELIKAVASKGGTTEAALTHFNENGVGKNIIEGMKKAQQRAQELSK